MSGNKWSWLCAFIVSFIAQCAWADTPESIEGTMRVTAEQAMQLIEEVPELVVIDAREQKERAKGYIRNSISLPDTDTTPESLAAVVPSKGTPVLFYCNGVKCGRSVKSAKMAVEWGYARIYWFRGGWDEWTEKGLPAAFD